MFPVVAAAQAARCDGKMTLAAFENAVVALGEGEAAAARAEALTAIDQILEQQALARNFVVCSVSNNPKIANAAAALDPTFDGRGYVRLLLYNPRFMAQLTSAAGTDWAAYFVLAHEVGHHVQGHTVLIREGSTPPKELQADEWAGFALARLNASLDEATLAIRLISDEQGSSSHPPRGQRLVAIERGWRRGREGLGPGFRVERVTQQDARSSEAHPQCGGPYRADSSPVTEPERARTMEALREERARRDRGDSARRQVLVWRSGRTERGLIREVTDRHFHFEYGSANDNQSECVSWTDVQSYGLDSNGVFVVRHRR
jgi:hypothetical protein